MRQLLEATVYMVVGYLVGLWLAPELFSTNIADTQWHNAWVYGYIFVWWGFVLAYILGPVVLFLGKAAIFIGAVVVGVTVIGLLFARPRSY